MANNDGTLFELSFTLSQDYHIERAEAINFADMVFSSKRRQSHAGPTPKWCDQPSINTYLFCKLNADA